MIDRDVVTPVPAATVVLMRDGPAGPEVLLTHRPSSMAFAPDMHVFPGGRVDPADSDPRLTARSTISPTDAAAALGGDLPPEGAIAAFIAAIREAFEETGVLLADGASHRALAVARAEVLHVPGAFAPMVEALDLRLRTDTLVPLSRWVTPPGLPRRFDARFFAAALPAHAEVSLLGDEVAAHAWHTPRTALDEMAGGRLGMWLPTSSTLQQVEHARSFDDVLAHLAAGRAGEIDVVGVADGIVRIEMPYGGGVPGRPIYSYLVGTSQVVLVDPGDPTGPALDRAIEIVRGRGGRLVAVALTGADPDHAAGAEAIRDAVDVPVLAGRGGGRDLPFRVDELDDGAVIEAGAMALRVVATGGPRPDHLAFVVEAAAGDPVAVLTGDLELARGAPGLPGPVDSAARDAALERLRAIAPAVVRFSGRPTD